MLKCYLSVLALVLFLPLKANAVKKEGAVSASKSGKEGSSGGPFSLVEWNPADLTQNRVRVSSEYMVVDGFAFGIASEFQRESNEKWRQSTVGLGMTATQYLESQSMRGLFAKGECGIFNLSYEARNKEGSGSVVGMEFELGLGYRFSLAKNITGAASYGVRRNLPDFFEPDGKSADKPVAENLKPWDVRLNLSLGVAI